MILSKKTYFLRMSFQLAIVNKSYTQNWAQRSIYFSDYLNAMTSEVLFLTHEWLAHTQEKNTTYNANWGAFQGITDYTTALHNSSDDGCCNDHQTAAKTLPDCKFLDCT